MEDNNYKEQKVTDEKNSSHNHDYDDVFKSMKLNNTKLFIPVINDIFGRNYGMNEPLTLLTSEGDITKIADGKADIHSKTSDFLLKIQEELYLIECQSYDDDTMAIRIAEYAFISAKQHAVWENGRVILEMPNYCVVYIKCTSSTPRYTKITYKFPDGHTVNYDAKNIIINDYTKEEIFKKRLYPYIPYYILRYEKDIKSGRIPVEYIEKELHELLSGLQNAMFSGEIDVFSFNNVKAFTNTVLEHFVPTGKKERLVKVMGGQIITTEADLLVQQGRDEGLKEGKEEGLKEGKEEGLKEGKEEGLKALVDTLKKYISTIDDLYQAVINNEGYKDVTFEEVEKLYLEKF